MSEREANLLVPDGEVRRANFEDIAKKFGKPPPPPLPEKNQ
jgi:hypothetical protein